MNPLWLQAQLSIGKISITEVHGGYDISGVLTKHVNTELMGRLMKLVHGKVLQGRHPLFHHSNMR